MAGALTGSAGFDPGTGCFIGLYTGTTLSAGADWITDSGMLVAGAGATMSVVATTSVACSISQQS
jgi:hypothetical protein